LTKRGLAYDTDTMVCLAATYHRTYDTDDQLAETEINCETSVNEFYQINLFYRAG